MLNEISWEIISQAPAGLTNIKLGRTNAIVSPASSAEDRVKLYTKEVGEATIGLFITSSLYIKTENKETTPGEDVIDVAIMS